MSAANIETAREKCRQDCARTWKREGNPWGYSASRGDVRRCEHGHIWRATGRSACYRFDDWERLSPFWEPLPYRRAVRALAASPGEGDEPIFGPEWDGYPPASPGEGE